MNTDLSAFKLPKGLTIPDFCSPHQGWIKKDGDSSFHEEKGLYLEETKLLADCHVFSFSKENVVRVLHIHVDKNVVFQWEHLSVLSNTFNKIKLHLSEGSKAIINLASFYSPLSVFLVDINLEKGASLQLHIHSVARPGDKFVHKGPIHLDKGAQGASVSHLVKVIQEKGANLWIEPDLRISHDQVVAKHGIAFSSFDKDQLNWLLTRGFDIDFAKNLLAKGHIKSVLSSDFLRSEVDKL